MRSYKLVLHKYKVPLSVLVLVGGIVLMVVTAYSVPGKDGATRKGAPLGNLRGINYILLLFAIVPELVGGYYLYDYAACKRKFESLMDTNSEAIFKRNQIELERLALRLSDREEARVLELMRKYKVR